MPNDAGLSVTLIVVLSLLVTLPFLVLTLVFVGRLVRNSARNRALLAKGEPAQAFILSASDTGVTVNDSPQVRLRLEVRPAGRPPYEAETTLLVGRLRVGMLAPGTPVPVKFDPEDPSRVAVASLGGYSPAPAA